MPPLRDHPAFPFPANHPWLDHTSTAIWLRPLYLFVTLAPPLTLTHLNNQLHPKLPAETTCNASRALQKPRTASYIPAQRMIYQPIVHKFQSEFLWPSSPNFPCSYLLISPTLSLPSWHWVGVDTGYVVERQMSSNWGLSCTVYEIFGLNDAFGRVIIYYTLSLPLPQERQIYLLDAPNHIQRQKACWTDFRKRDSRLLVLQPPPEQTTLSRSESNLSEGRRLPHTALPPYTKAPATARSSSSSSNHPVPSSRPRQINGGSFDSAYIRRLPSIPPESSGTRPSRPPQPHPETVVEHTHPHYSFDAAACTVLRAELAFRLRRATTAGGLASRICAVSLGRSCGSPCSFKGC